MPFPASAVANYFLEAGKRESVPITPMKLQKLVFFAHGWHLGVTGEPLVNEQIQAWNFGPVIPSLYHEFKEFKNTPITRNAGGFCRDDLFCREDIKSPELAGVSSLLDRVWSIYSRYTAAQLSALSHEQNGPWDQVMGQMPDGEVRVRSLPIPNSLILTHFKSRLEKN